MKKKFVLLSLAAILITSLTACAQTDVVATTAVKSFDYVIGADSNKIVSDENEGYTLLSPDSKESFSFGKSISIAFELAPFENAGLDKTKLPNYISVDGEKLIISMENNKFSKESSANKAFEKLVANNREAVGYHAALDHYGVALGNGNMFEWAKDITTNDKDIVFVLNPQPFIDAGVDVENLDGWVFAKVETMEDGKKIEVDKLLKPYDIK